MMSGIGTCKIKRTFLINTSSLIANRRWCK